MKTRILPGYSLKNKEWVEETKKSLDFTFPTYISIIEKTLKEGIAFRHMAGSQLARSIIRV